jgi:F-type H+-transporting ATPase subunit b
MPQLDPSSFGSQLFWLAITFSALFIVLTYFILPRIGATLEARQTRLQSDFDAAERMSEEAKLALSAYEEALSDARVNAVKLAQTVRNDIQAEMDKEKAAIDAQIASRIEAAEARLKTSRDTAMAGIAESARSIVADIVEVVSGQKPSETDIDNAISRVGN